LNNGKTDKMPPCEGLAKAPPICRRKEDFNEMKEGGKMGGNMAKLLSNWSISNNKMGGHSNEAIPISQVNRVHCSDD
jgi:hypothetical protein